jgi:uncharacterized protein with PIN domain
MGAMGIGSDRVAAPAGPDDVVGPMSATVHVAASLRFFLSPRHRRGPVRVAVDGTSTVLHVIESLGVPRTEIGRLLVHGEPSSPQTRAMDGDVVDVAERPRPQPTAQQRFVLDVHLGALARLMRLVGLDTTYSNTASDHELVAQAVREHRVLLTKDRGILRRRALPDGAYVRGDRPEQHLADVLERFEPALRPWSRCPACNGTLGTVPKLDIADLLPAGTRRTYEQFSRCQACGRVYWRGAHRRRLEALIDAAQRATRWTDPTPSGPAPDPAVPRSARRC